MVATPMIDNQAPTVQTLNGSTFSSVFGGSIAQRLLANNLNMECLRTNATLRDDEWEELDRVAIDAFNDPLIAVDDLRSRGLTHDLGGLGTLVSQYNRISEMNEAEVSMWASMDGENNRVLMDLQNVPVPVIFKDWQLDIRTLESSRRLGEGLDTLYARAAARVIGEKLEDMLFNGLTTVMGGTPIYGYRTEPNRNTSSGSDWGTATNIYPDILTMVGALYGDNVRGPFVLYLHNDQYVQTLARTGDTNITWRQFAIDNIPELQDIKLAHRMTAGEGVLVNMDPNTVDLAVAEDFMPVEWEAKGGLSLNFRNLIVAVPRVKSDYHGRSGVYHITGI